MHNAEVIPLLLLWHTACSCKAAVYINAPCCECEDANRTIKFSYVLNNLLKFLDCERLSKAFIDSSNAVNYESGKWMAYVLVCIF